MSLLRFLIQKNKSQAVVPPLAAEDQDLPNPHDFENPGEIQIVNEIVKSAIQETVKEKKRGSYGKYDDEFKLKVARWRNEAAL